MILNNIFSKDRNYQHPQASGYSVIYDVSDGRFELLPPSQKERRFRFKIYPKKNNVFLNLACVHVHVDMQQSINT
jgi:hypothetical protein